MGKSTLILMVLAALGLGALIGASLVEEESVEPEVEEAETPAVVDTGGAPMFRFLSPESATIERDDFGQAVPTLDGDNFVARDGAPKSETITINLDLDAAVEYKALMQQGDVLTYRWSTDGNSVYYDFHAHDDAFGAEFFTRYAEGEGSEHAGAIMAPYTGQHGWFWLNIGDSATAITLEVSGFYDEIVEIELRGY